MLARELSDQLWNGIADLVRRTTTQREVFFCEVVDNDPIRKLIYCGEYGSMGIPLVALSQRFSYYDTQADGSILKRQDDGSNNPVFLVDPLVPNIGDIAVIMDVFGAHSFPFCIGIVQSKSGFWEES